MRACPPRPPQCQAPRAGPEQAGRRSSPEICLVPNMRSPSSSPAASRYTKRRFCVQGLQESALVEAVGVAGAVRQSALQAATGHAKAATGLSQAYPVHLDEAHADELHLLAGLLQLVGLEGDQAAVGARAAAFPPLVACHDLQWREEEGGRKRALQTERRSTSECGRRNPHQAALSSLTRIAVHAVACCTARVPQQAHVQAASAASS